MSGKELLALVRGAPDAKELAKKINEARAKVGYEATAVGVNVKNKMLEGAAVSLHKAQGTSATTSTESSTGPVGADLQAWHDNVTRRMVAALKEAADGNSDKSNQ